MIILTSLIQVTFGTGFPDAEHSRVTSVPFFTTMLPSSGLARTLGGTVEYVDEFWLIWKTKKYFLIVSHLS